MEMDTSRAEWAVIIVGGIAIAAIAFSTLGPIVTLLIFIAVAVFQILLSKHS